MVLSSLRVRALGAVERTLRRWLGYVEDQLEAAEPPPTPPERQPFVSRQPAPPDHWVELVRESAPQLLQPAADADDVAAVGSTVIDYRAPAAPRAFSSPLAPARPLSFAPAAPLKPPASRSVSATSSPKRPLRLEPVRTQPTVSESLVSHPADVAGASVEPPTISTKAPPVTASRGLLSQADAVPVPLPTHRIDSAAEPPRIPLRTNSREPEVNPLREISTQVWEDHPITDHFADLPDDPILRAASTSVPQRTDVPIVRTREGRHSNLNQQRTSVPLTSNPVTARPTTVPPSLNIEDVQAERWPSLLELPDEAAPYSDADRERRERLLREQEGRAWSE